MNEPEQATHSIPSSSISTARFYLQGTTGRQERDLHEMALAMYYDDRQNHSGADLQADERLNRHPLRRLDGTPRLPLTQVWYLKFNVLSVFVGHYAASFAVKAKQPKIPLWQLFIAVQFVDILFFGFTFFGIERFNLVPNFTESTHWELVYMPYTHSLGMTFMWGLFTYGLFRRPFMGASKSVAALFALAVMSHWFLDLIVHTPDLPLLGDDSTKVGFGLWRNDVAAYLVESLLLAGGAWLMIKDHASTTVKRRITGFVVAMLAINAVMIFGPAGNATETTLAVTALVSYFGFAGVAWWTMSNE